ncbi:MAG: DUF1552 domain-containing protein [Myxococcota bacterium]
MPRLTRRGLLAGLGFGAGAVFLDPFFRAVLADGPIARRFVFIVEGNCIEPLCFLSPDAASAIQDQASAPIAGLRWAYNRYGHSSPITVRTGDLGAASALDHLRSDGERVDLTEKAAVLLGLSSTITGGGHSTHFGALSCSRSTSSKPAGQTIDCWLAEREGVRSTTPFDAVRVGMCSDGGILANFTCAFGVGRSAPVTLDPVLAYTNLFGFIPGSSGATNFTRRSQQLDFGIDDVNAALAAFPGNSRERAKLEAYLDSLLTLRQRQDDLAAIAAAINPDDPTTAFPAPEDPRTNPLHATGDHFDILEAQFENVAAALLGGLTNVAVITSGTGGDFGYVDYRRILQNIPGIPSGISRHDLHHAAGTAANANAYADGVHAVTREHVRLVADLARKLDAVPEGDGTMLDHTVILYMSDNGEQHHSTASEWPCLLLGGGSLGLKTEGQTLVYPSVNHANNRQMSNLFNTIGYLAGETLDDFGMEGVTRITEGPLTELMR